MDHSHHHHHHTDAGLQKLPADNIFKLAVSATLHCLIGCGVGEVFGMILATWLGLSMVSSMILAIVLGFIFGFALGILPLIRKHFSLYKAFKIVLVAEGLSIVVMEAFEVLIQVIIPGVLTAGLTDAIFWIGMLISLVVGFIAAFPVNYYLIKKGIRHVH